MEVSHVYMSESDWTDFLCLKAAECVSMSGQAQLHEYSCMVVVDGDVTAS